MAAVVAAAAAACLSPVCAAAASVPRARVCFVSPPGSWSCLAASNGRGLLRGGNGMRLRWRAPVRAKVDEDKEAGLGFREPERRRMRLRLRPRLRLLWWRLRRLSAAAAARWPCYARRVPHDEGFLLGLMRDGGVDYRSAPRPAGRLLVDMLSTLLTLWVSLLPMMWFIQRQMSAGGGAEKRRRPRKQRVGFDDVQGVDEAKEELVEVVSCLHGSLNYKKLGAKLPRGVLLVGPPGTGKTLLARAVAGEAGIPFFSVSASEFVEVFVGRGAARVRDLFKEAKEAAPSIIFIDELDAVGGSRGRSFNDERDQTLNQLLTEMDGFDSDMKVIVMAATNRPKALDPALCRPGRFSRKVLVGVPDLEGRRNILAVHLRDVPLEEDPEIICDLVASLTPGLVGADLANIVNEAALLAARRGGNTVAREDIMDAIEREKYGVNGRQENADSERQGLTKLFPWLPKPGNRPTNPDDIGGSENDPAA
uniref:AAA+ ATPase domain-containing protein n=1 Tax=Oryza glumipatula TaxID=40148 RepID=A0A0D9ZLW0_9ORYZ